MLNKEKIFVTDAYKVEHKKMILNSCYEPIPSQYFVVFNPNEAKRVTEESKRIVNNLRNKGNILVIDKRDKWQDK